MQEVAGAGGTKEEVGFSEPRSLERKQGSDLQGGAQWASRWGRTPGLCAFSDLPLVSRWPPADKEE